MTADGDVPPAAGRVYFPELDGLRFFAFLLVYIFHGGIPQLAWGIDRVSHALGNVTPTPRGSVPWSLGRTIASNGWVGVQLFFLLSGYLIATLLLREEQRDGRIDLRAFWMRRILRIWPLYYSIVLLTFFLLPILDGATWSGVIRPLWTHHLPAFLAFLGNWSMALIGPVPYDAISILWSVCVEEQFYLFCPLLLAWVRPSARIGVVLTMMAGAIVARWMSAEALARQAITPIHFQFSTLTQLDTLLSGVLLALLTSGRTIRLRPLADVAIKTLAGVGGLAILVRDGFAQRGPIERAVGFVALWSVGLAIVAASASGRGVWGAILRHPRLVRLGRISYGLYMYHEIAFWMQRRLFDLVGWFPFQEFFATIASFALTVGLASASYRYLETPFLRRKSRWSRVASRPI